METTKQLKCLLNNTELFKHIKKIKGLQPLQPKHKISCHFKVYIKLFHFQTNKSHPVLWEENIVFQHLLGTFSFGILLEKSHKYRTIIVAVIASTLHQCTKHIWEFCIILESPQGGGMCSKTFSSPSLTTKSMNSVPRYEEWQYWIIIICLILCPQINMKQSHNPQRNSWMKYGPMRSMRASKWN